MIKGDMVDKIMAFENGEMTTEETIDFFGELIKSGLCWQLQGCYGRTASRLIELGYLKKDGTIIDHPDID